MTDSNEGPAPHGGSAMSDVVVSLEPEPGEPAEPAAEPEEPEAEPAEPAEPEEPPAPAEPAEPRPAARPTLW